MKTAATLLSVMFLLSLSGCQKRDEQVPKGMVRISVDQIIETTGIACIRLELTFKETHTVRVNQRDNIESALFEADPKSGLAQGSIVFLADLFDASDALQLKWLSEIRTESVTVGGPAIQPVEAGKKLEDIVKITITAGDYPIGTEIELGMVNGKALNLRVE